MIYLNRNINKQLENIYQIKFHQKYKIELKDRIISFVEQKLTTLMNNNFKDFFILLENLVLIEQNKISCIKEAFLNEYKLELFNSFNPLWYKEKPIIKKHVYKENLNEITLEFMASVYYQNNSFFTEKNIELLAFFEKEFNINLDYLNTFKNIKLSKEEYSYFYLFLEKKFMKNFRIFCNFLTRMADEFHLFNLNSFEELFVSFNNHLNKNLFKSNQLFITDFYLNNNLNKSNVAINFTTDLFIILFIYKSMLLNIKEKIDSFPKINHSLS